MTKPSTYPQLDGLLDLACRDGVEIRPTLLRVITDLYVQKPIHSAEEEAQYVELALGLIEAVDAPTRAAVVARLSAYPAAPVALLRKLTGTESPPASEVSTQPQSEADGLIEMFFGAEPGERRLILVGLDAVSGTPSRRPVPASSEVVRRLETAALQRNTGEFSRMLARALGISQVLAERIARDHSGEPIVVAAKAFGMQSAVLQRILLFLNPDIGQSVEQVYDLARFFDDLSTQAAERMVAIWRKAGGQSRPVYEPAHWDDERRGARTLAAPERHVARGREEHPPRIKASRL